MNRDECVKAVGANRLQASMVKKAYDIGYAQGEWNGRREGVYEANKYNTTVMSGLAIKSMHDAFGFGRERLQRFIAMMWEQAMRDENMSANDLRQEVLEKWDIDIGDPLGGSGMG